MSSDRVFGSLDEALILRARRSTVLASNLANADTPGYKARDLDFGDALKSAQASSSVQMRRTHPAHVTPQGSVGGEARLMYRNPEQPSLDGNTVDTQKEQARFSENAVRYQTTLSFLSSKVSKLKSTLKGE